MFIVIDCGSTKTRLYFIRNDTVAVKGAVPFGTDSTVSTGSNTKLRQGIADAILKLLADNDLKLSDIRFAIASGMITSNLGLLEVPHLVAPVRIDDLAKHTRQCRDHDILPLDLPVVFIPGIKNSIDEGGWDNIRKIDLMRGEETQAVGILTSYSPSLPCNIIELGSTTKLIHLDRQGNIAGSVTTLSGQVYGAILKETFLSASVKVDEAEPPFFSEDVMAAAYRCVEKSGLLRTLLFTRFIQFSLPTTASERKFFCEAAIAADDMKLFNDAEEKGFDLSGDIIFVGNEERCKLYAAMIRMAKGMENPARIISAVSEIDMLAVNGANYIAKQIVL